ncbi:hypothetical protein LIER_17672 [Lithospermum erythrorhizon]|uniref:Pentatricopeptide repeat-containing protein n=1 Tax=Lithospermum erythrorhizon TaxID=34254 RepID=A0AAV3QEF6_LITER
MALYMPLFRACSTPRTLTQLHAHLIVNGLHNDHQASTKLIELYAQKGNLKSSKLIFNSFKNPDSFMYGVIIKCHVWNNLFQDSIFMYQEMVCKVDGISNYVFPSIFKACSGIGDLGLGQNVHGRSIKLGFESDIVNESAVLSMYGELGCLSYARRVFDKMIIRDVISWSSIVTSYVKNGEFERGLEIFGEMVLESGEIDAVSVLSVIEACGELGLCRLGKSVHGYVVRRCMLSDGSLESCLIAMYGKCSDLVSAERVFSGSGSGSTSTWTAMISSCNQVDAYEEGLRIFIRMMAANVEPNEVTLMSIICSCARLGWLREGKSVHGFIIRSDFGLDNDLLRSALIDLYANSGKVSDCYKIFDPSIDRHVVSWNMLISGFSQEGMWEEALMLFVQMLTQGITPDSFSLATVVSVSGNFECSEFGRQVHGYVFKTNIFNEYVQNSLIDMYSKCGYVDLAYLIFEDSLKRSVVTWNSMMCGFSHNGYWKETLILFDQLYVSSLEMNEVTFISAIQACSNLGYLDKGKWIHHKLITYGIGKDMYINTALIDMYAKCGHLQMAQRIFDSMLERSIVSWSAMIDGYGMHGHADASISLFTEMVESGTKPNDITFMSILSACSHAGYVEKAKMYFNSMRDFGNQPKFEHYACLVDILSRAGDLSRAYEIIKSMAFPADSSIWGALVNGCRIHRRMDFLKSIQENLDNLCTNDTGFYTLLSNIYADEEEWNKLRTVRSTMRNIGLTKVHAYSMIEADRNIPRLGAYNT